MLPPHCLPSCIVTQYKSTERFFLHSKCKSSESLLQLSPDFGTGCIPVTVKIPSAKLSGCLNFCFWACPNILKF